MAGLTGLLEGAEQLRPLPAAAGRVIAMLSSDQPDLLEVAQIVRLDETLSLAVLRAANSAVYGVPGRSFDLREATVRLGVRTLSKLVLELQVAGLLKAEMSSFGLRRGALWRGALGGAIAAEGLASDHAPELRDLAFVGALFRDIGKLVIEVRHGGEYERMVATHLSAGVSFDQAERAAFGADHAEVGAALATHWGLPPRIADAVRWHHAPPPPESAGHDPLFDLVHTADLVCLWADLCVGVDGLQYRVSEHVREALSLTRRDVERRIAIVWDNLRAAEEALAPAQPERRSA